MSAGLFFFPMAQYGAQDTAEGPKCLGVVPVRGGNANPPD
jgi:hypothetical protein